MVGLNASSKQLIEFISKHAELLGVTLVTASGIWYLSDKYFETKYKLVTLERINGEKLHTKDIEYATLEKVTDAKISQLQHEIARIKAESSKDAPSGGSSRDAQARLAHASDVNDKFLLFGYAAEYEHLRSKKKMNSDTN